jgi:hypothetical protein
MAKQERTRQAGADPPGPAHAATRHGIVPHAPRGRRIRISARLRHLSRVKPALAVGLALFADRRPNDVRSPGQADASKFGATGRPLRVL